MSQILRYEAGLDVPNVLMTDSIADAAEAGFETFFIEDVCRDIDMTGSKAATHHTMRDRGITIVTSEATLGPA